MTGAAGDDPGRLVIGSRRSPLARAQAELVGRAIADAWPGLEVVYEALSTEGDRDRVTPLPEIGGKGLFTADLVEALENGRIDAVVHSLKDLPTADPGDETLAAIPEREDARDVLVLRESLVGPAADRRPRARLADLPEGLRIGTSSVRRAAQIRLGLAGAEVLPVRGNVGTRLSHVEAGDLDGVVLAAAGLRRIGVWPEGAIPLDPPDWLPAPGQGALAVQVREGDDRIRSLAAVVGDPATTAAVRAERALLARLEGGCHVPVGAFATVDGDTLRLAAAVYPTDAGRAAVRGIADGAPGDAVDIGVGLAEELLAAGAERLL